MKKAIIKEQLQEKLNKRKVIAAAFYTFNFQPDFFENYILPTLVSHQTFSNSPIYNAVIWRTTPIPPTVVYYDDGIPKDKDSKAPLQDYTLCPVRITQFFHPKASYILVEDKNGKQSLIVLIGSNNITRAGWCDNIEAVTIEEISLYSKSSVDFINGHRTFIEEAQNLSTNPSHNFSVENQILDFLERIETTKNAEIAFHSSLEQSFQSFLEQNVFQKDTIKEVEIYSPFFQKTPVDGSKSLPLEVLQEQVEGSIKCLVPLKNHIEVQLEEHVFKNYQNERVIWCDYASNISKKLEGRYNHSKVYRFKGQRAIYTIIGSVNFTKNAWSQHRIGESGNVETAILYKEPLSHYISSLSRTEINENWTFLIKEEQIKDEKKNFFKKSPVIEFVINWQDNTISYLLKDHKILYLDICNLKLKKANAPRIIKLNTTAIHALAKNPILKVIEEDKDGKIEHYYYPHQIGILQRPFLHKLSFRDMRKIWELLGEPPELVISTIERLVNKYEKADGTTNEIIINSEGIINKMAAHIDGLVQLEHDLFQPKTTEDKIIENLTVDLFGSLPYYRRYLLDLVEKGELNKGFAWVILKILENDFYNNPYLHTRKTIQKAIVESKELDKLKSDIEELKDSLSLPQHQKHLNWISHQLSH